MLRRRVSFPISEEAQQDLRDIHVYWAERASLQVADRLIDAIMERLSLLGEYPYAGTVSSDMGAGVRCFPAGKYLIYYRTRWERTEIFHIFRGARAGIGVSWARTMEGGLTPMRTGK